MKHIISTGSKYVIECPECDCKFSFEREDIINASQLDPGDVICPQCGAPITDESANIAELYSTISLVSSVISRFILR